MAQVTIHKDPGVEVDVIDGSPPEDQSALIAELRAEIASEVQSASAAREALAAAISECNVLQAEKSELAGKIATFKLALAGLT